MCECSVLCLLFCRKTLDPETSALPAILVEHDSSSSDTSPLLFYSPIASLLCWGSRMHQGTIFDAYLMKGSSAMAETYVSMLLKDGKVVALPRKGYLGQYRHSFQVVEKVWVFDIVM